MARKCAVEIKIPSTNIFQKMLLAHKNVVFLRAFYELCAITGKKMKRK